ncbi:MAG TPA: hypothetical protein CFH84_10350 [Sulfurimonas sp. UBA12504]|nr:MAG TPA: hypothetical protein CFH84_10350 [Sulfurimonas sp. UBA12504]
MLQSLYCNKTLALLCIHEQSRQTYGTRRLKNTLLQRYGIIVSRRRIKNIMLDLNLFVKMKRKFEVNTTDSNHDLPIAPNNSQ